MIETRRWWILEALLPALVNGDESGLDDQDRAELQSTLGDFDSMDGGRWSATAEIVSTDEFRMPNSGNYKGRCAQIIISREVEFPAHVWVGHYGDDEQYHCTDPDGRVCATEDVAERYIKERKFADVEAVRADLAPDLYHGLDECADAIADLMADRLDRNWPNDELRTLLEEHKPAMDAYRDARDRIKWEVGTDGGTRPTHYILTRDKAPLPGDDSDEMYETEAEASAAARGIAARTGKPVTITHIRGPNDWADVGTIVMPITGREAIEIHTRTPGSKLFTLGPDHEEPMRISEGDAWDIVEFDPCSVYVVW